MAPRLRGILAYAARKEQGTDHDAITQTGAECTALLVTTSLLGLFAQTSTALVLNAQGVKAHNTAPALTYWNRAAKAGFGEVSPKVALLVGREVPVAAPRRT